MKKWMPRYNEDTIDRLHSRTLKKAQKILSRLNVFCCRQPDFGGFNGWVFERTIEYCLRNELKAQGIEPDFKEGYKLEGRVKVDLAISNVLIEIKLGGIWGKPALTIARKRKQAANRKGLQYLMFLRGESVLKARKQMIYALGQENVFFLDKKNDWVRFVNRIVKELNCCR
jgi:hypothetical protein